jgi:TM2 domain-containing membrane protein YozV
MAFCANCGLKLEEGVKFCSGCGTLVASAGVEIKQEKAVNFIQAQPSALSMPPVPQNQTIAADEKYCFSCGSPIKKAAEICPKCGVNQNSRGNIMATDVYCTSCGKSIKKEAATCPFCGVMQATVTTGYPPGYVPKNWTTALLLLLFLGPVGAHRFYVGKTGTAILTILVTVCTLGLGCIIWYIVDLVSICSGKFTDKQGYLLKKN